MNPTNRYIIGFVAAVGIIALVIVLIVRSILSSPSNTPTHQPIDLPSYATTLNTVQLTIDAPEVAPDKHHDVIITVGQNQSTIKVTNGYNGNVIRQQTYPMTTSSYAVFLRALYINGFTQGDNNPANKDERGQCALGTRYIYEVIDAFGTTQQHYWRTTCGTGTFNGTYATILRLFELQIPDFSKQTTGIVL